MALIHTCYRITDVDRSVAFYEALGFEEVGRIPIRDEAVNVFMNQPGDGDMPRLELTYNFGVDSMRSAPGTATSRSPPTTSTRRSPAWPSRASSRRSRPTRCARAARGCASSAIPTGIGQDTRG